SNGAIAKATRSIGVNSLVPFAAELSYLPSRILVSVSGRRNQSISATHPRSFLPRQKSDAATLSRAASTDSGHPFDLQRALNAFILPGVMERAFWTPGVAFHLSRKGDDGVASSSVLS